MQPPGHGAVMHRPAAGLIAVVHPRQPDRSRGIRVRPPNHRLDLRVRSQVFALEVAQFVQGEISGLEAWPTFKANDLEPGLAEFSRHDAAHGANADDHHIRFFGCHGPVPPCEKRRARRLRPRAQSRRFDAVVLMQKHIGTRDRQRSRVPDCCACRLQQRARVFLVPVRDGIGAEVGERLDGQRRIEAAHRRER